MQRYCYRADTPTEKNKLFRTVKQAGGATVPPAAFYFLQTVCFFTLRVTLSGAAIYSLTVRVATLFTNSSSCSTKIIAGEEDSTAASVISRASTSR